MAVLNDVTFDGFNFTANNLVITNLDYMTVAQRENQIDKRANRDGGILVQSLLGTKPILIEGYYTGTTQVDAQNMYDTLVAALNRQQRVLSVPHAGGYRRFTCTPSNIVISQPNGYNRVTFSIQFVVPEGNSVEPNTSILVNAAITTTTQTIPLTVAGSVRARPVLTLTFTSIVGGTGATITIRNGRDFIGLTISGNFVTGDTLIVDADNMSITLNGVKQTPVGRIPTWETGGGSLYYSDTFTSRTGTLLGTYNQKNL